MTWRTGRIWRLGEKELVARKYFPPSRIELHDAQEDDKDDPMFQFRFHNGLNALQLTSVEWHRHWGSHG